MLPMRKQPAQSGFKFESAIQMPAPKTYSGRPTCVSIKSTSCEWVIPKCANMGMQTNNTVRSDERTSNVDMITPPDPRRASDVQKSRRMRVVKTTRHFERARGFPLDKLGWQPASHRQAVRPAGCGQQLGFTRGRAMCQSCTPFNFFQGTPPHTCSN
jgi:hypothetical protein